MLILPLLTLFADPFPITAPPASWKLSPFYEKHVDLDGFPVLSSAKVSDYALKEAAYIVQSMTATRPEILKAMAANKVRLAVMAAGERTVDIPEHSDLKPAAYWNRRARGLGSTPSRPAVSCAEENLLCLKGDPYSTENILVHEFAHAMHEMGMNTVDPTFDKRLKTAFESAKAKGLWKGTYAASNRMEYWAEGVQSWFGTNRHDDNQHNHVDTRDELKAYDPDLAKLIAEVYPRNDWQYIRPPDRKAPGHLTGYNPANAPTFSWDSVAPSKP